MKESNIGSNLQDFPRLTLQCRITPSPHRPHLPWWKTISDFLFFFSSLPTPKEEKSTTRSLDDEPQVNVTEIKLKPVAKVMARTDEAPTLLVLWYPSAQLTRSRSRAVFFPHTADREWAQKSPRENRSHAWENSPAPAARLLELHRLATCLPPMIILYTPFIIILPTLFLSLPQTVRDSWSAAHAERLTDRLLVNIFKILRFSLPPELAMGIYAPLRDLNLPAKRILNTNSNF